MSLAHTTLRELVASLARGQRAMGAGDFAAARQAVADALAIDPENVQARDLLHRLDLATDASHAGPPPRVQPAPSSGAAGGRGATTRPHGVVDAASWTAFEQRVRERRIVRLLSEAHAAADAGRIDDLRRAVDELEAVAPHDDRVVALRASFRMAAAPAGAPLAQPDDALAVPLRSGAAAAPAATSRAADPVAETPLRPTVTPVVGASLSRPGRRRRVPTLALAACLLLAAGLGAWAAYSRLEAGRFPARTVAGPMPGSTAEPVSAAADADPGHAAEDAGAPGQDRVGAIGWLPADGQPEAPHASDPTTGNAIGQTASLDAGGATIESAPRNVVSASPADARPAGETSTRLHVGREPPPALAVSRAEAGGAASVGQDAAPSAQPDRANRVERQGADRASIAEPPTLPSVAQGAGPEIDRSPSQAGTAAMARAIPPAVPLRAPSGAERDAPSRPTDTTRTGPETAGTTGTAAGAPSANAGGAGAGATEGGMAGAARSAVDEYRRAFNALDANAAVHVWPTVDRRALDRAFRQLATQSITFDQCDVTTNGVSGKAVCSGRATWAQAVGDKNPRAESRTWRFTLAQRGNRWIITDAAVARR
jgi:hypothetical protein